MNNSLFQNAKRVLLPAASGALALTSPLSAQSSDTIVELAPFTVEADGVRNTLQITERDLSQRQATDLEDALSLDPSITVGGSTAVAQKIYVRSIGEAMLNVSVDGATQSGALFHHLGRNLLEPELLKRIEIQSGIGNATDGPGALGGAIRFVTKDPSDLLRQDQRFGALLKSGYYSNTDGFKASATLYGNFNDTWSGLVSYVTSEHDDLEDAKGNVSPGSNSDHEVLFSKLVGELSNGQRIELSFENIQEDGDHLRRPEWSFIAPNNPLIYLESERDTAVLNYQLDSDNVDWLNLETRLSFTEGEIRQGDEDPYMGNIESTQLYLANTQNLSNHEITYGVDYREDHIVSGTVGEAYAGREQAKVRGVFAQDRIQASEDLVITLGARFDDYELNDLVGQTLSNDGFSPNLGVAYSITPEITLTAGSASAYRGPEINDAFKLWQAGSRLGSANDPNLKGESARNNEIAINYYRDGISFELGLFNNTIDDIIVNTEEASKDAQRSVPWGNFYTNLGELETRGFYARASYSADAYNISLLYDNSDTTVNGHQATRYQYGSIAATMGNAWVLDAFWKVNTQLDLGWNVRLVEGVDDIDILIPSAAYGDTTGSIDKPGYSTHDFYLRWSPERVKNVTFNLTVKNVFDKLYRSHGSMEDFSSLPGYESIIGAYEPGRDVRLSASYKF
ncbi:TonB-dependent receptor [Pelagicoccus sp. SDUM812003]|uniref:TonB-dependent receptor domain-containing protein n=1 Tax=Pelagicoccus sp. SDUM812003 TaxID=3041267 RepID=UPI00280E4C0C|nr:TonB-dependent receptor [Pelagicoccus sp. SDUM812003]MDQ8202594.1 TonB-dependent receptor [Pelagicoccus sp. SDUM812003]